MADRPVKPFDTTLLQLVRADPRAWLALIGWSTTASLRLLDSNVSALQAEVDAAIRVDEAEPWTAHLEFQTTYDPALPKRLHDYNGALDHPDCPVRSPAVLLRPVADGPALNGRYERRWRNGHVYRWFEYGVLRLWERPVDELLEGPLAVLPLAPVAELFGPAHDEAERLRRTTAVIHRLGERVRAEATPDQAPRLWSETFFVLGYGIRQTSSGDYWKECAGCVTR